MAKKKTSTEIVAVPREQIRLKKRDVNIETLLQNAIDKGVPVETMERLLAMRAQLKAERAKEAYDRSMALFQAKCPTIVKTKEVRANNGTIAYKYAPIESIVAQVKDLIEQCGFSYSFNMILREGGVKVTCKVTHEDGHSEEKDMDVPFGTKTAVMSQSQVAAAATTFAKRYAFCNAFGIMTGDEDTDARAGEAQADRMASYQVHRVVPTEDDEAGGYVNRPAGYPKMDSTNDAHGLDEVAKKDEPKPAKDMNTAMKMEIALLLKKKWNYTVLGKEHHEVATKIFDVTGLLLTEENFKEIITRLKHED